MKQSQTSPSLKAKFDEAKSMNRFFGIRFVISGKKNYLNILLAWYWFWWYHYPSYAKNRSEIDAKQWWVAKLARRARGKAGRSGRAGRSELMHLFCPWLLKLHCLKMNKKPNIAIFKEPKGLIKVIELVSQWPVLWFLPCNSNAFSSKGSASYA